MTPLTVVPFLPPRLQAGAEERTVRRVLPLLYCSSAQTGGTHAEEERGARAWGNLNLWAAAEGHP